MSKGEKKVFLAAEQNFCDFDVCCCPLWLMTSVQLSITQLNRTGQSLSQGGCLEIAASTNRVNWYFPPIGFSIIAWHFCLLFLFNFSSFLFRDFFSFLTNPLRTSSSPQKNRFRGSLFTDQFHYVCGRSTGRLLFNLLNWATRSVYPSCRVSSIFFAAPRCIIDTADHFSCNSLPDPVYTGDADAVFQSWKTLPPWGIVYRVRIGLIDWLDGLAVFCW